MAQAMDDIRRLCGEGNAEAARLAVRDLVTSSKGVDDDRLIEASGLVDQALNKARSTGSKPDQGSFLAAKGLLLCATAQDSETALSSAEEVLEIAREGGQTELLAAGLEVLIRARALQNDALAGFRVANAEIAKLEQAAKPQGQATVLEVVVHCHAAMGEPNSAIDAAQKALALYRSLAAGEKDGLDWQLRPGMTLGEKMTWAREQEGNMLHTIAEMRWALGDMPAADQTARQALTAYQAAKNKPGQDRCLATISSLCASRGQLKKAPNRQEAVKALKELAQAIKNRDAAAFKDAEERLDKMRDLIADEEIAENIGPLMQKDETVIEFLKEQGWAVGDQPEEESGKKDTYIRQFHHRAFYLNTLFTGMGFGPQFRPVYPYRVGRKREEMIAVEVAQLPECEAWQMEMLYRPGIIDSAIQHSGTLGFP